MKPRRVPSRWIAWVACALGSVGASAWAQGPCHDFAWDVSHERALFSHAAQAVPGAPDAAAAATVRIDRLYAAQLAPQGQVRYVSPPGKAALADGAFGGLLKFRVPHSGSYRVALDAPYWIDVVAHGTELATEDFSGQHGCANPRKIVIYQMPAGEDLWLQISGVHSAHAEFTITEAPAAGPAAAPAH